MSNNLPNITSNPFQAAAGSAAANNLKNSIQQSAGNLQNTAGNLQNTAGNLQNNTNLSQLENASQQKLNQAQSKIDEISKAQNEKINNLKEAAEQKADMAKSVAKAAIVKALVSLLIKFINNDKIISIAINNLVKKTKDKLNNKGRVEVKDKSFVIFYPKFTGDYSVYKREFEKNKSKLLKIIRILKTTVDGVSIIIKVLRVILTGLQLQVQTKRKKLLATAAASAPDLASPSSSKPIAAKYPINKELDDQVLKNLEEKIANYISLINYIQNIINIIQPILTRAKAKVDRLSFNIYSEVSNIGLPEDTPPTTEPVESDISTEYNNGFKNFTIEVITTPSGALQAVAYDAYSKMKITQTAPSKTRKADELIDELKQILG